MAKKNLLFNVSAFWRLNITDFCRRKWVGKLSETKRARLLSTRVLSKPVYLFSICCFWFALETAKVLLQVVMKLRERNEYSECGQFQYSLLPVQTKTGLPEWEGKFSTFEGRREEKNKDGVMLLLIDWAETKCVFSFSVISSLSSRSKMEHKNTFFNFFSVLLL